MAPVSVVDPVAKALWYIENHFDRELDLETIAGASDVSRFYLSRAFGEATGYSVMAYVRGRRLTEAARALADGAPDILAVAVDFGYASHEAFTRAFRERFGVTPQAVRTARRSDMLPLVAALRKESILQTRLEEPRIEKSDVLLVAGQSERFIYETVARIPLLWQRFARHIGHVPGAVDRRTYGVRFNSDSEGFEYMAGVAVTSLERLPDELRGLRIAAQTYAVFVHRGHVSAIRNTMDAIWSVWLPASPFDVVDAPDFERYGDAFDPETGNGEVEICLPITRKATAAE